MKRLHQYLGGTSGPYTFFDQELRRPLGLSGTLFLALFEPDASGIPSAAPVYTHRVATGHDPVCLSSTAV